MCIRYMNTRWACTDGCMSARVESDNTSVPSQKVYKHLRPSTIRKRQTPSSPYVKKCSSNYCSGLQDDYTPYTLTLACGSCHGRLTRDLDYHFNKEWESRSFLYAQKLGIRFVRESCDVKKTAKKTWDTWWAAMTNQAVKEKKPTLYPDATKSMLKLIEGNWAHLLGSLGEKVVRRPCYDDYDDYEDSDVPDRPATPSPSASRRRRRRRTVTFEIDSNSGSDTDVPGDNDSGYQSGSSSRDTDLRRQLNRRWNAGSAENVEAHWKGLASAGEDSDETDTDDSAVKVNAHWGRLVVPDEDSDETDTEDSAAKVNAHWGSLVVAAEDDGDVDASAEDTESTEEGVHPHWKGGLVEAEDDGSNEEEDQGVHPHWSGALTEAEDDEETLVW